MGGDQGHSARITPDSSPRPSATCPPARVGIERRPEPMSEPALKPAELRRLLVADDEHLIASGMAASLRGLGYEVIGPAADGQQAIDLARSSQPDMAMLDIRMPLIDGLACAGTLWSELGIPAVIVSAYSSQAYLDQAQEIGVFGFLLKPVTPEALRVATSIAWARAQNHLWQSKRITQLEGTLAGRRTVEMAKWKLIEKLGITEADAHARLQQAARSSRRRLIDVAQDLVGGVDATGLLGSASRSV